MCAEDLPIRMYNDALGYLRANTRSSHRMGNVETIMKDLTAAFLKARYGYEKNMSLTRAELDQKSEKWIAEGARDKDADFRFHPMETNALLFGLGSGLQSKLSLRQKDLTLV